MNVHRMIALSITAAGLFAAVFFTAFTVWELMDDELDLIDDTLDVLGRRVLSITEEAELDVQKKHEWLDLMPYWVVVTNAADGRELYRSPAARLYDIPGLPKNKVTIRKVSVPDGMDIDRDSEGRADFRARCRYSDSGRHRICLAWPLDDMQDEFRESMNEIILAWAVFTALLLIAGWYMGKSIVWPIREINRQASLFSESQLERRLELPEGGNEYNVLAASLNKLFDRLERAFRRQKRLIADASHELKTPLAVMRLTLNNAEMAAEEGTEPDVEKTAAYSGLLDQVLRMERLVKSLLELSVLEAGAGIKREWVDLRGMLVALAEDYKLLAENGDIALHVELPDRLMVTGDQDRLYRAFSNLLDNAVKYNRPGGEIRLIAETTGDKATISLVNTGVSLPEVEMDRIFEPFYRVDKSRARELGGSGLGLAIVKRIIELHKGAVTIHGTADGLTWVRVTLPAA